MKDLIFSLRRFVPVNEQEERDLKMILGLAEVPGILTRECAFAHFSASAWVTDPGGEHFLMAWHKIYRAWAWTGGHADGEEDLEKVALREAREESGIAHIRPVRHEPFSAEVLTVDGHIKRGVWVPGHLHLNVTYLLLGDRGDALRAKDDENTAVKWMTADEIMRDCSEEWMKEHVYKKLIPKTKEWLALRSVNTENSTNNNE